MRKVIKVVLIIFIGLFLLLGGFFTFLMIGQSTIKNLKIENIDLTNLADGDYEGEYNHGRWTNKVVVSITDHKITNIDFTKIHTFDNPEVRKKIVDNVINEQSLDIDTISGATISTKAYLKAIDNALNK